MSNIDQPMTVARYIELLQAMPQDALMMRAKTLCLGNPCYELKKPSLIDITEHEINGERYWFEKGEFWDDPDEPTGQQTIVRV